MTYPARMRIDTTPGTTLRRAVACALLPAAGVMRAPACVDNESSLVIRACLDALPPDCEIQADPSSPFNPHGVFDLVYQSSYGCALLVGNQVVRRGDSDTLRTET